jgi:hypothetical protein
MKNWFFASRVALFMFSVSSSVLFFGCVITAQIWSSLLAPSHCSDFPAGFYFCSASRPGLGRPPAGQACSVRWRAQGLPVPFFFLSRSGGRWLVRPTSFFPHRNLRSCSTDSALAPQRPSQSLLSAPSRFIFYHFHSCGSSSLLALWNCHHGPRYFFSRSAHHWAKVPVRG